MGTEMGRQVLGLKVGEPLSVLAGGAATWKHTGATIDWATVPAAGSDLTLVNGTVIKNGAKYLRYGLVMAKITASGLFGPADTTANDGREALVRGNCFVVYETFLEANPLGLGNGDTNHLGLLEGGLVWADRLLVNGMTQAPFANFPTLANLLLAMPLLRLARN